MFHLSRFYVERKPKTFQYYQRIVSHLKAKSVAMATSKEIADLLGSSKAFKSLQKQAEFKRLFSRDEVVPYRTLFPDAPENDWRKKKLPEGIIEEDSGHPNEKMVPLNTIRLL